MSSLAALARSAEIARLPFLLASRDGVARNRWLAMGDPQTTHARLLEVLDRQKLLGDDGMLALDVGLISIGDHFDFGAPHLTAKAIGAEGLRSLRWLAAHPPDQVVILAGNHDLSRVQELGLETDETFAEARALALQVFAEADAGRGSAELERAFVERFPSIATSELARRDYMSFSEEQRALVQALLVSGRMVVAHAATLPTGEPVLLTHAGITSRELTMLGEPVGAEAIADALNAFTRNAIERARGAWERGERLQLDLSPLHVFGREGREGGGLFYHRPARPYRPKSDAAWEFFSEAPRRYDPRSLPQGLVQVCGHSGHKKCRKELDGWVMPSAEYAHGGLRTLAVFGDEVRYEGTIVLPRPGEATLYLIDAEMNATDPARYELLPLAAGTVSNSS
jgi:hypothetical protein